MTKILEESNLVLRCIKRILYCSTSRKVWHVRGEFSVNRTVLSLDANDGGEGNDAEVLVESREDGVVEGFGEPRVIHRADRGVLFPAFVGIEASALVKVGADVVVADVGERRFRDVEQS